ncbi:MAG: GNAT family N-acetyltransferase, partial [Thermoplasmata archaeon]|nr:GNAT family N-acetyltransferase [Thermoplasmata archaeon]
MGVEFRKVCNAEDMDAAKSIRLSVFVDEQNVPPEIEMDEYDELATHVLYLADDVPVGTGRLVDMPDGMKLGRVAVLSGYRSLGIGTEIVKWLLDRAKTEGHNRVYANVQINAREFYETLGFKAEGDLFLEAGIEHVKMVWN